MYIVDLEIANKYLSTNKNLHDLNSAQGSHVIYLYIKPIYIN